MQGSRFGLDDRVGNAKWLPVTLWPTWNWCGSTLPVWSPLRDAIPVTDGLLE